MSAYDYSHIKFISSTDGLTVRGCSSFIPEYLANSSTLCSLSGCNNKVFPDSRQICFQCTGIDNECIDNPESFPCTSYASIDSCYTAYDGSLVTRGCFSDIRQDMNPCDNQVYCQICNTSNCNNEVDETFRTNSGIHRTAAPVYIHALANIWIFIYIHS